ncbi:MAG: toprim domain-containing protein, partial [Deltaproteobacteria bacterium]|nr:toprim domain-containing protein [Deltaproteobacteria bacterium]
MKLIVVESPNKCKKIREYLGAGYEVVATVGHFRDLPERELGVDVATMTPSYVVKNEKAGVVKQLRARAKGASEIILATDADREGEAISWHVAQTLGLRAPK